MGSTVMLQLLLLCFPLCSAYAYENVALRGTATQSTHLLGNPSVLGIAINAIDGNRNSQMMAGSCTHTAQQANPWWRVDLLESYIIDHINIVNRGDCCSDRINGAQIHIGDSADWSANPQAGTIDHLEAGDTYSRHYQRDVKGRYVTVLIAGANKILSLCEVEVYGYRAPTGENLALGGAATQSSLYATGVAYNAIDGNRNNNWNQASCTHTEADLHPWWRLDLRTIHKVFSVKIVNRDSFQERLNGAEILIGDSLENNGNNNPRCGAITNAVGTEIFEFDCKGMEGLYVNVVIPGRMEYLTLCEVEVYGSKLD
uniref:Fucolectin tachylectin-4 pentraxin-1 domain-containing protein n=1 Tax=Nothobranchius pienaari TaxID=704102 RepID=A0A1A8N367_9TELE